ncbi:MAG: YceI family protein [Bacteroidetes bacterium]|nr:YceI family protein [Bacteroidota bacterium]
MKKIIRTLSLLLPFLGILAFNMPNGKLVSKSGHINFFSHTVAEDISSNNYKVVSTLDVSTGEVVFSVPMQSFEFEKALMQKHFNSKDFLNTKQYPKAKFVDKITNLGDVDFTKDGAYQTNVSGELTIMETTQSIQESGTITIKGSEIIVETKLQVVLADYKIAFTDGKPSTNIAKTIDVTAKSVYSSDGDS